MAPTLAPVSAEWLACKICGKPAHLIGTVDFNRACDESATLRFGPSGLPVPYHRCEACGFLFTSAFDDWSNEDFVTHIYNADYALVDPQHVEIRPRENARILAAMFARDLRDLAIMDYGGGNGRLAALLGDAGFAGATSYDPFVGGDAAPPARRFDVVTCFEVVEHVTDPDQLVQTLAGYVEEGGMIIFSTLPQEARDEANVLDWSYVAPRNGHVSIFTTSALTTLWRRHGFTFGSFNEGWHAAFRAVPDFALHLFGGRR